jgi:hypothetical protein
MNPAGAAAHRWGWSVNRTDSTANNAQPKAKGQQDHAGEDILLCRDERGGDESQGSNESSSQRSGDDQPDAS